MTAVSRKTITPVTAADHCLYCGHTRALRSVGSYAGQREHVCIDEGACAERQKANGRTYHHIHQTPGYPPQG